MDSIFRVFNEGGSCWFKLVDVESYSNQVVHEEQVQKKPQEDLLNLEGGQGKIRVLQGFNQFVERRSDADTLTETQRVTMRAPTDPPTIELTPFTVFPAEFFIESESFVDI